MTAMDEMMFDCEAGSTADDDDEALVSDAAAGASQLSATVLVELVVDVVADKSSTTAILLSAVAVVVEDSDEAVEEHGCAVVDIDEDVVLLQPTEDSDNDEVDNVPDESAFALVGAEDAFADG